MHKSNYIFKKFPRTLNEAFPYTREASVCVYKPCPYDAGKGTGFWVWICVVFLSIFAFAGLILI